MKQRPTPKPEPEDDQHRLAVLIDADNVQASVIEGLLREVARYGVASVKRIYGDFTSTRLNAWKDVLLKFSINPVQQFPYTSGKNATDSSLIIDAMDLMYTRRFDGFCLVSSDSDFTRLAQRMREEGLTVYGFGEKKTPDAFRQACDKFVFTEVLRADRTAKPAPGAPAARTGRTGAKPTSPESHKSATSAPGPTPKVAKSDAKAETGSPLPLGLIREAIEEGSDDEGWAHLGAVGSYLTKIKPDFDPRLYGYRKLSDLVRGNPGRFDLEERGAPGSSAKSVYVRLRAQPSL